MIGLSDHNFIVTGAASGIGNATARRLLAEGAGVALFDQNGPVVRDIVENLRALGGVAVAVEMDVTSRTEWRDAVQAVIDKMGSVRGLVNNAGVVRDKTLLKLTDEDWDQVIDVSLRGAWLGCQHVIPFLKENGGSIVNLSSDSRWGAFGQANYAAAKSGLVGLTRTVALEHGRHGIRANAVAPGTTDTPMLKEVPESVLESWLPDIPLGRVASPEEIASVIAFLLSEDASYLTGQIVGVNGGAAL